MDIREIMKPLTWDTNRGRFLLNMAQREILPSWLYFVETDVVGAFNVAAAPAQSPPVSWKQPYSTVEGLDVGYGTPFLIKSFVFEDSTDTTVAADFTVRLFEIGEAREFMNNIVHIRTIAGTAQQPALLREFYFFRSQHIIQAQFAKVAGGAVDIRAYFLGTQFYPWSPEFLRRRAAFQQLKNVMSKWNERRKYVTPYWLTTDIAPIALAGSATGNFFLKVGDDGPVELFALTSVQTGNYEFELTDVKRNQTLMNGLVTGTNAVGDARFPMLFPKPYIVPPGMRLRLTITDLSTAPNTIWITLWGRKIYAPFRDAQEVLRETVVPNAFDLPTPIVPKPY